MFEADPGRRNALLGGTDGLEIRRVLDLGCGAGQEMLPFVTLGAQCIGMDIMPEVGQVGRKLFNEAGFGQRVEFLRGSGNDLPFLDESFDVLICRGALMFMDNRKALGEMARIIRPGGRLLLMYQSPAYYWWKFKDGLRNRYYLSSIHSARVAFGGLIYKFTGVQPFNRITAGGEIFQTKSTLEREFARIGLKIVGEMPDSNNQTPSLVIAKE